MKKIYTVVLSLAFLPFIIFSSSHKAYADGNDDIKNQIKDVYVKSSQVNNLLNFSEQTDIYPHATGYYDDLVVHFENDQLMRDTIADGIES